MKVKWYLFLLSIITISFFIYSFFDSSKQSPTKIGILMIGNSRYEKLSGLKAGLNDLGYKANEFQFIVKNAKDDPKKLTTQTKKLLNLHPDLIVTLGGIESMEIKKWMDKEKVRVPVVFAGVASPQEIGLIQNYKKPGSAFTGINNDQASISGKRLELLHDLVPSISRVHILYDANIDISKLSLKAAEVASRQLSIPIKEWNVSAKGFMDQFQKDLKQNDALLLLPGYKIEMMNGKIVKLTKQYHLPAMGIYEHEARHGYLASYGASFSDQGYQAARFVSLIMKGNEPGDIPVELPDRYRFIVNKMTENSLGLPLNKDLLYIAEFVTTDKKAGVEQP
ncbi:ABC transporter substrate-binding protein [Neobacillus sp. SM06]|uniref:ABC transporter substrate-binding protein n=1 Tax=Neobacillus sp. SM06 TaxID=3422492 RepID=UPI003D2AA72E